VATQTGPGSQNRGGRIRTSQHLGTTVAARVAGPTSSARFRYFFEKDGPGFAPTFRAQVPSPKTGIHELLPSKRGVPWPPRRPTFWAGIRAHFFEISWFPRNFFPGLGLRGRGADSDVLCLAVHGWVAGETPPFGTSALRQRGPLPGAYPRCSVWRGRTGRHRSRFGSLERTGGFTSEHVSFEGYPERNAPEGNQVASRVFVFVRRRHLCVETARVVAWGNFVSDMWRIRKGKVRARFGSAGRGGAFTSKHPFF